MRAREGLLGNSNLDCDVGLLFGVFFLVGGGLRPRSFHVARGYGLGVQRVGPLQKKKEDDP